MSASGRPNLVDFRTLPIVRRLWDQEPPAILYHYTSRPGLQGILEAKTIWASEARYLNDARELATALDHVREILATRDGKPFGALYPRMSGILEQMEEAQDTFVFSMSNDGGDELSQWRAYARPGNGYAIGFDAPAMKRMLVAAALTSHFAPCEYDPTRQRALMTEVIATVERVVSVHGAQALDEAVRIFGSLFLLTAPIVKHGAFRAEREWRLVLPGFSTWDARVKFRDAGRLLVPFWTVPLNHAGAQLPITEVVIGPTPHPELEARAMSAILTVAGLSKATVRRSSVPYRDW
jgi:DUF2971 family protein